MKLLASILFALTFVVPTFSQSGKLAKSDEEYTRMYRDSKFKMARNHAEFYTQAKKNATLWKYFKDRKFALAFLEKMEFSVDGLRTIDLQVEDKQFESAVGRTLGFDDDFWMSMRKGYCCEGVGAGECLACSVHSKCLRGCGKSKVKGNLYDPVQVVGSGL